MSNNRPTSSNWQHNLVTLGSLGLALGLIGLCVHATLAPGSASQVYGVPAAPDAEPWVRAAGARDGALGLAVLLVLWRHRSALSIIVAASLLVPLADAAISLSQGAGVLGAAPHLLGVGAIAVLLALILTSRNR